jgi:hypothetical protein
MDCKYHAIIDILNRAVCERIEEHYTWDFFWYWLGDESNLGRRYKESFEEVIGEPLNDTHIALLENKGRNLEKMIGKWSYKWHRDNPALQNENMPIFCVKKKIHEYLINQLKKPDIIEIIGNPC